MRAIILVLSVVLAACDRPPVTAEPPPPPPQRPSAVADAPAPSAAALPADVEAQRANAETCEHFAGEEPYDADRLREINAALADTCKPLKAALPGLKAKYADDPAVTEVLAAWEEIAQAYGD